MGIRNRTVIDYEWNLPGTDANYADRGFVVTDVRIPDLEREGVEHWSATVSSGAGMPKAGDGRMLWFKQPQLSRDEFAARGMEGDYYTPVYPQLATTWKKAAELEGFGLKYPPTVVFYPRLFKTAK